MKLRVAFIHGAGVVDAEDSLAEAQRGLLRSGRLAGVSNTADLCVMQAIAYRAELLNHPMPDAAPGFRPKYDRTGVSFHACPCCTPSLGYKLFSTLLEELPRVPNPIVNAIVRSKWPDVSRYLGSPGARGSVLAAVVAQLDALRPNVIIGHSLGSVVAVDALQRLPVETHPALLLTAGSPLAWTELISSDLAWSHSARLLWLNLVDTSDAVTAGMHLDWLRAPAALNYRVNNDVYATWWERRGDSTHSIQHYLTHPVVARLFYALHGGQSDGDALRAVATGR